MVETYSRNANRNMRRPVVKEEIVDFMRTRQAQNTGYLKDLEDFARQENIPIIPHETVAYFRLLMQTLQPQKILEIGTAIGYSALLMADNSPQSLISTIERNPEMLGLARENLAKFDSRKQISLLEGEAMELLPNLPDDHFDFVFMDSAKSKYIVFLPEVLKKVKVGGLIVIDFIDMTPVRHQRAVENRLREAVRQDRARIQISHISRFGLLEMSRQRLSPSLGESSHHVCPRCSGTGTVRDNESLSLSILRLIEEEALKENTKEVHAIVPVPVASYLLNEKRAAVSAIEARQGGVRCIIVPNDQMQTPHYHVLRVRKGEETSTLSYLLPKLHEEEMALPVDEEVAERKMPEQPALATFVMPEIPPAPAAESSAAAAPKAKAAVAAAPAAPGLISRFFAALKNLFAGAPEAPVEAQPEKQQETKTDRQQDRRKPRQNNRRDRNDRNDRNDRRNDRSDRNDRSERRDNRDNRSENNEGREQREDNRRNRRDKQQQNVEDREIRQQAGDGGAQARHLHPVFARLVGARGGGRAARRLGRPPGARPGARRGLPGRRVAALRGHDVTLFEKTTSLGGQLNIACVPPRKEEMRRAAQDLIHAVCNAGVHLCMGQTRTAEQLKDAGFEAVINAVGAHSAAPRIPGIDSVNVADAWKVLAGEQQVYGTVAVIGGGMVGCETAEYLAARGCKVSVIEMMDKIAAGESTTILPTLLENYKTYGVEQYPSHKVKEFRMDAVVCENKDGAEVTIPCDYIVLAMGARSNEFDAAALEAASIPVYSIGDAAGKAADISNAIRTGYDTACQL